MPEIKSMNLDEVEARKAELGEELAEASNERLAEISAELDELEARKAELADMAEKRAALEARDFGNCSFSGATVHFFLLMVDEK